ncbi:MAG: class I SAM-dependent methyltransferase, partial [Parachlamydiaceae bacterium]
MVQEEIIPKVRGFILQDKLNEALSLCLEALKHSNDISTRSELYEMLGDITQKQHHLNETITYYINALNLQPNDALWVKFANSIKYAQFNAYHPRLEQIVIKGLSKSHVSHQHFAFPGISLLKLSPSYAPIPELLSLENPLEIIESQLNSHSLDIVKNRLFLTLTEKVILADADLEKLLTYIRKALLKSGSDNTPLLYALAMQCFLNEYVYCETQQETALITGLIERLSSIEALTPTLLNQMLLLACYRPIAKRPFSQLFKNVNTQTILEPFKSFIQKHIQEPLEEEVFCKKIPSLNPIQDHISLKVQEQYEENPYPRWTNVDKKNQKTLQQTIQELFPHHSIKIESSNVTEILIAGCGTGQHAINCANQYQEAKILAVDLSQHSLAYAARKAAELNIRNIEFLQADILDLKQLNRTFDLIESAGVLHHMEDPLKGWKILRDLLKPQGMMLIGLYSQLARQDVQKARSFIQVHKYPSTVKGIRECRQHIFTLPNTDPIHALSSGVDFYTTSSCRDLLFHVKESQFTLSQIEEHLKQLDLAFLGFEFKNSKTLEN